MFIVHYKRPAKKPALISGVVFLKERGHKSVSFMEFTDMNFEDLITQLEDESPGKSITFVRIHLTVREGKVGSSLSVVSRAEL